MLGCSIGGSPGEVNPANRMPSLAFAGGDAETTPPVTIAYGDKMPIPFRFVKDAMSTQHSFGVTRMMCDPALGAKELVVVDARFPVGQGHAFHKHPGQEEVIYVISGRIEQWVGEDCHELEPGDTAFILPGQVHASFNIGNEEARIVAILGPAVGESGTTTVDVYDELPWREIRRK